MSIVQQIRDESPEDLRDRARKARDLAAAWHVLLTTLADELDRLATEKEAAARSAAE